MNVNEKETGRVLHLATDAVVYECLVWDRSELWKHVMRWPDARCLAPSDATAPEQGVIATVPAGTAAELTGVFHQSWHGSFVYEGRVTLILDEPMKYVFFDWTQRQSFFVEYAEAPD